MRTDAGFEAVEVVSGGTVRSAWRARHPARTGEFLIKLYHPDPALMDSSSARSLLVGCEMRAKLLEKMSASGAEHWVRIHEVKFTSEQVLYVCDYHPMTLKRLMEMRIRLRGPALHQLVTGMVAALRELEQLAHRSHGNLKPANILLTLAPGEIRDVALTDPHGPSGAGLDDRYELGRLICNVVLRRETDPAAHWPIPSSAEWNEVGPKGDAWRELCNRLLHPNGYYSAQDLDKIEREIAQLAPQPPQRRFVLVAVAAAVVLAIAGAVFFLTREPVEPTVATAQEAEAIAEPQTPIQPETTNPPDAPPSVVVAPPPAPLTSPPIEPIAAATTRIAEAAVVEEAPPIAEAPPVVEAPPAPPIEPLPAPIDPPATMASPPAPVEPVAVEVEAPPALAGLPTTTQAEVAPPVVVPEPPAPSPEPSAPSTALALPPPPPLPAPAAPTTTESAVAEPPPVDPVAIASPGVEFPPPNPAPPANPVAAPPVAPTMIPPPPPDVALVPPPPLPEPPAPVDAPIAAPQPDAAPAAQPALTRPVLLTTVKNPDNPDDRYASVVFVCDTSLTMKGVLDRVQKELLAAIDDLQPEQSFNIVLMREHFTKDRPLAVLLKDRRRMLRATPANKDRAKAFVKANVVSAGATCANPDQAFQDAFLRKPNLVYLVTGRALNVYFNEEKGLIDRVQWFWKNDKLTTHVHTVAIFPESLSESNRAAAEQSLRRVAQEGKGRFHIAPEE